MLHGVDAPVSKGTLNLRECIMQEWTYRHDMARVDIAGVDNAGVVKSAIC